MNKWKDLSTELLFHHIIDRTCRHSIIFLFMERTPSMRMVVQVSIVVEPPSSLYWNELKFYDVLKFKKASNFKKYFYLLYSVACFEMHFLVRF